MAGEWIEKRCSKAQLRLLVPCLTLSALIASAACTTREPSMSPDTAAVAPAAGDDASAGGSIAWPEATECASLVRELAALDRTVVRALDPMTAPLAVTSLGAAALAVSTDLPIPEVSPADIAAAPCAILVGTPVNLPASADTILDRRTVHSAYPTGKKRRRNPDHQALERELAKVQRGAADDVDVIATGDPMLDLVGTVVGGVISGIGAAVKRSDVRAAETALAATPAFIEDPILRAYRFELVELEAERRLAVPIALYDRALGQTAETTVTLTEQRRFAVGNGRHPADIEPQHAADATPITAAELAAWRRATPPIATSMLLTHLATAEPTVLPAPAGLEAAMARLSGASRVKTVTAEQRPGDARTDVASGMPAELAATVDAVLQEPRPNRQAAIVADQEAPSGLVRVGTDGRAGFYVTPEHALVPAEALGHSSLLVVHYPDGMRAHGLVELVDETLGLALVFLPRRGAALPLRVTRSPAPATSSEPGLPWRDGESVIGVFVTDPVTAGSRWIDSPTLDRFVARLDTL